MEYGSAVCGGLTELLPDWRSTPTLHHSNTPSLRVAGLENANEVLGE